MAIWDKLKGLFGGEQASDNGIYFYVRCGCCGDRVRVRLNPSADLQQDFGEGGEGVAGYTIRKVVVDGRCFRPMEVQMRFDSQRRETAREIEGGIFISREEYETPPTGTA